MFLRHWPLAILAVAMLGLAGCADSNRLLDPERAASLHRIGVVAAVNEEVHFLQPGLTIFDNKRIDYPVPEWKLNDYMAQSAAKTLSSKFEAVIIRTRIKGQPFDPFGAFVTLPKTNTDEILNALEDSSPVDAYLVIVRDPSVSGGGHPSFVSRGSFGLVWSRDPPPAFSFKFTGDDHMTATMIGDYYLIDASTRQILASYSARGFTRDYTDRDGKTIPIPLAVPSRPEDLQKGRNYGYIHDIFYKLIDENTADAMSKMKLIP